MTLNCIAVDDEPLALDQLGKFIEQTPFLKLEGKYANALHALKAVHMQKIDLIFLDIQMPDLNGIELARVLGRGPDSPCFIFTTAYHQFALEGYKVNALDYLLKPFNYEEFLSASQKALHYAELLNRAVSQTSVTNESGPADAGYLFLKVEHQLVRVALDDILYIEGLKDYVKIELRNTEKAILSLTSLKALEGKLSSKRFMRIHRSFIISLDKVTSMTRNSVHIGKKMITVGDQYRDAFAQFAGSWI